ncbi:histone deacetylase family protein [Galbibacter mesophilus]|uniref:histone deacetylase family protein n=1 Tax=Galbibacter mesophilus TaxID=379069 RepID=UPI00191F90D9|nr:histone deacetylase [Galbibacter mesophilus]MCM5662004.1 histone deacetylase [Galbibacter mesophilus]
MLKIAYHPIYQHPLPEGHRFPMVKYDLLPKQLLHEGIVTEENFFKPSIPNDEDILRVHTPAYLNDLKNQTLDARSARKIGFPLSEALVNREVIIADGSMKCCEFALENGVSMNIAGGTHHAYSGHGEAFCLLNDQAIAARYLQHQKLADKILVVDLDVHQGNGTAAIFENDESVFTFSMHGKNNYPFKKEKSDLDIALDDDCGDETYLSILEKELPKLIANQKPDFIFYLCGVDVIKGDKLGRLGLSMEGCKKRDEIVLELCKEQGIPVQCSMGGGYSPDIKTIVAAHTNTFKVAQKLYF